MRIAIALVVLAAASLAGPVLSTSHVAATPGGSVTLDFFITNDLTPVDGFQGGYDVVGADTAGLTLTSLVADPDGALPPTVFSAANSHTDGTGTFGFLFGSGSTLSAGTTRFLSLTYDVPNSVAPGTVFPVQFVGTLGTPQVPLAYVSNGAAFDYDGLAGGSITVRGQAVPEPGAGTLLVVAAVVGCVLRRRRRTA